MTLSRLECNLQKTVIKYDFKRPNKYSKEHLENSLHDLTIITPYSLEFFVDLSSGVQIKIATVDQTTYEDFVVSISSPVLMTMFNIKPQTKLCLWYERLFRLLTCGARVLRDPVTEINGNRN